MGRALALLAAAASLAALLSPGALEPPLRESSRLALAGLPWVALAGLPAGRGGGGRARRWPLELALALPALALGAWLDLRAGLPVPSAAWTGGTVVLVLALLGEAAHRAPARPRLHAAVWAVLVAAGPLLAASLGASAAGWLAWTSPLAWLWGRVPLSAGPVALAQIAGPFAAGALLLALVTAPRAGADPGAPR